MQSNALEGIVRARLQLSAFNLGFKLHASTHGGPRWGARAYHNLTASKLFPMTENQSNVEFLKALHDPAGLASIIRKELKSRRTITATYTGQEIDQMLQFMVTAIP